MGSACAIAQCAEDSVIAYGTHPTLTSFGKEKGKPKPLLLPLLVAEDEGEEGAGAILLSEWHSTPEFSLASSLKRDLYTPNSSGGDGELLLAEQYWGRGRGKSKNKNKLLNG